MIFKKCVLVFMKSVHLLLSDFNEILFILDSLKNTQI